MTLVRTARLGAVAALALLVGVSLAGCQYGYGARPLAPSGEGSLGMYARVVQGDHFCSDLGAEEIQRFMVTQVAPGGPADRAGIKPGCLLLKIDGHTCRDAESLIRLVRDLEPGRTVNVVIYRNGKREKLELVVARSTEAWGNAPAASFSGMMEPGQIPARDDGNVKGDKHEDEPPTVPGLYAN